MVGTKSPPPPHPRSMLRTPGNTQQSYPEVICLVTCFKHLIQVPMCLNGLFEVEGPDTENGLSYARISAFQKYCEGHACGVYLL